MAGATRCVWLLKASAISGTFLRRFALPTPLGFSPSTSFLAIAPKGATVTEVNRNEINEEESLGLCGVKECLFN